jgi:hypothetical protein
MRVVILLLAILALSAFIGCQAKPMVVSESGSGSEGIKVHGDWTVEVTNPDGSLETRREFSNAWVGHVPLAAWLSEDVKVDARYLVFTVFNADQEIDGPVTVGCEVPQSKPSKTVVSDLFMEASVMRFGEDLFGTQSNQGDLTKSVWSGSCKIDVGTWSPEKVKHIWAVKTAISFDSDLETVGPYNGKSAIYPAGTAFTLSQKSFSPPLEVVDGQVIAATVTLSSGN